ncbi:mannose-1-phosphate guanylyltransferase [Methanohalophilus levihalophilus]|uniref:nucleotidyltransferase family protein n=1 Tax=Methanohalophilus levihalophilus TaxID=1431282 RepID=UPI001AE61A9A|nr:NDP-sugar synthase [Methanohalophilus levihalophilus]MBP2030294.1 mannose-1-phosphate guanylyltransferase [Methanohalophilus levihalophilus]
MKACIMCGGEGTRLRPLTFDRPKPNIPITNKPSLVHLIEHLSKEGFNDIVITVGYMAEKIEEQLGDGSMFGVHIDYVYEDEKLGTAGGVKNAEKYLKGEPFIVVGGDHVMDLELRNMFRFHESNNAMITIGLLSIDDPREFGIADMDVCNRISRFLEKPGPGEIFSNLASTGIYMCQPEIFDWIPEGKQFDFAKDLFPKFLEENIRINGLLVRGHWTDVGNPQAYRQAQRWMLETMPGTSIEGHFNAKNARIVGPLKISNNVVIGSNSAVVGPVVLGENTTIGDNVLIGPYTTIAANCVIKDGCRILSSYIYSDVTIGKNCNVSGSVIDSNTVVGQNCSLENGTVIGPRVNIGNDVTVHSDVKIWPEVAIKSGAKVQETLFNPDYK